MFFFAAVSNPLGDDRFASMFTNKDFQVDIESEEYKLIHPVISKQDKVRRNRAPDDDVAGEAGASDSGSDDDNELWEQVKLSRAKDRKTKQEEYLKKKRNAASNTAAAAGGQDQSDQVKMYSLKDTAGAASSMSMGKRDQALGERLTNDRHKNIVEESGTALGSREITFTLEDKKAKRDFTREQAAKEHKQERKKSRRPMGQLLAVEKKKPVYWKGKRVK